MRTAKRILSLLLLCLIVAPVQAADSVDIKVALNFNFAKYAQWPGDANRPIHLCYFQQRYQAAFERLIGKQVAGRDVAVKKLGAIEDVDNCQLVYIDQAQSTLVRPLLAHINHHAILTVSDIQGFVEQGGMIEIIRDNNHFRFKINLRQLKQANIEMSSQVLKLAVEVKR